MKVTAIKVQVKNPERVSIYIDEKYALSLTQTQLLEQKLRLGLEVDDQKLHDLKKASDFGKLRERLLRYAMLRPRSRREIEDYCRRKRYDSVDCVVIINWLLQRGYVNDAAFARAWIENRRLNKAVSKRRLVQELKQKGIHDDVISQAMAQSEYTEHDALVALIAKKRRQTKYRDDQKLMQYLVRQGFGCDDVKQALQSESES